MHNVRNDSSTKGSVSSGISRLDIGSDWSDICNALECIEDTTAARMQMASNIHSCCDPVLEHCLHDIGADTSTNGAMCGGG